MVQHTKESAIKGGLLSFEFVLPYLGRYTTTQAVASFYHGQQTKPLMRWCVSPAMLHTTLSDMHPQTAEEFAYCPMAFSRQDWVVDSCS